MRRWAAALLGLVLVLAAAAVVLLRHPASSGQQLDPGAGARAARQACAAVARVRQGVTRNVAATTVLRAADEAASDANTAQLHDPRWVQLYSAALELADALHRDQADEAQQATVLLARSCQ